MKVLVISDIHGNRTALEAVLRTAGQVDAVWCLGDLIGYGPDPNDCVAIIRDLPNLVCLRGNHDSAVIGLTERSKFNYAAQEVLQWTAEQLNPSHHHYLRGLDPRVDLDQVTLAHGSPRDPIWEYIMDVYTAYTNFQYFSTPICFVGHSHLPVVYTKLQDKDHAKVSFSRDRQVLHIDGRTILNPGSVGQPRDHDPRAAFAIYDTDQHTWTQYRVAYEISAVQKRMVKAGLPVEYIQRLDLGW